MRRLLLIPLVLLVLAAIVQAHRYIIRCLVTESGLPPALQTGLTAAIVVLGLSVVPMFVAERRFRQPWRALAVWPASLWMGVAFLTLNGLWLSAAVLWGLELAYGPLPEAGPLRAAVVGGMVLSLSGLALRNGLRGPRVRRIEISPARWPEALDGFRIVQISDIHVGPILGADFARGVTTEVNALEPDLVAVTGDLVDGPLRLIREGVEPFAELEGRLGTFFVTGNHDYFSGVLDWVTQCREMGLRVLRNERVTIHDPARGGRFELAGTDDYRGGGIHDEPHEDLDAALEDLPPDRPTVLLAHDPTTFRRARHMGIALQLSGHTHGGQIFPFWLGVKLVVGYVSGLYRHGDAQLYVSRGTGFWGPPMRLGAPAEITEITLRAGGGARASDARC